MTHPPRRTARNSSEKSFMVSWLPAHAAGRRAGGLKVFRDACVESARRCELRGTNANSGTVTQFVGTIEQIDHDQASIEVADKGRLEVMDDREVDIHIERHMVRVRKATAQTA